MAASVLDERFAFVAEWNDTNAQLVREYQLFFYPTDNSVEMFDIKNRRTFLKRTKYETVSQQELFVGSSVNIYSRQLKIKDFADEYTRNAMNQRHERVHIIIKKEAVGHVGAILDEFSKAGFIITQMRSLFWQKADAEKYYASHQGEASFDAVVDSLTGVVFAVEVSRTNACQEAMRLAGPESLDEAQAQQPQSIRARYGVGKYQNALHIGTDADATKWQYLFSQSTGYYPRTARLNGTTLCIIKPHAYLSGLTGQILDAITSQNFRISDIGLFNLDRHSAEEFLEVYKGVVPEYNALVSELISGPCIAAEIIPSAEDDGKIDVVEAFRDTVGPTDPEIARYLRPKSIRSRFGVDKVKNGIHCTDLPEDGALETEYFFRILSS